MIAESAAQRLTAQDIAPQDLCAYSPAGDGVTDAMDARFLHPTIAPEQRVYFLEVQRSYPDVVYAPRPVLPNSFDGIRAELVRLYGRQSTRSASEYLRRPPISLRASVSPATSSARIISSATYGRPMADSQDVADRRRQDAWNVQHSTSANRP
jgi:hypothetical protein